MTGKVLAVVAVCSRGSQNKTEQQISQGTGLGQIQMGKNHVSLTSCFIFVFYFFHRFKDTALGFSRQKTQNQQFYVSSKTAYILTILNHFFKVQTPGRLEIL